LQICWDGGSLLCCEICPVSVHPECLGWTREEADKCKRFICPHHECYVCGRKAAAVGGLLFR
jgi:SWI/SNF-related matrix-associated actin-dependent regulator of chromatin subfamily A member 5